MSPTEKGAPLSPWKSTGSLRGDGASGGEKVLSIKKTISTGAWLLKETLFLACKRVSTTKPQGKKGCILLQQIP